MLFETLSPLIGISDPGDNLTPPIGTTDRQITPSVTMDLILTPINDSPKNEHTGSSRYASTGSRDDSKYSIEIQRMCIGPRAADLLRKKFERNEAEAQEGKPQATLFMNMVESDQVNSYFRAAMKKYELEEARMNGGRSAVHPPESEIDLPDVDMELVGSRRSRSHDHDRARRDQGNKRLPQVSTAGHRMNEEQARNWISKVKSAFLRDRVPDADKCRVFRDLLTGPARDWYNRLSRSTRTPWKARLEGSMAKYGGKGGIYVGRLDYQARKRSNEIPLDYLYHLNVAAIRAKFLIRDGSPATSKEHVNHYIGTLDDRDLARMLTMFRLVDADDLEEMLQECESMEVREAHASMGSS
ncbi:unnamed protein product [Hyaloperonospora brassicae]|uniref:Retrotransposon gag domain-containing protein n=1 Tax=Hyaloperonospora brassicae TaxID=162125 RepID=A0AAV0UCN6_HYABA|nr:unnamed protein product [Hyaloperonospora brassicae]